MSALRRYFLYYVLSGFHPGRRDFISGGLGIEARYERCKRFWAPHLALSRAFQDRAIAEHAPQTIALLGAGRLLDSPSFERIASGTSVTLYDADPGCAFLWRRVEKRLARKGVRIQPEIKDLSGCLDVWSACVQSSKCVIQALRQLGERVPHFPALPRYEAAVSLNLLSQIPLYWEDRVTGIAKGDHGKELIAALEETKRALEVAHLRQLTESASKVIILITDRLFHHYRSDRAEWETETALRCNPEELLPGYHIRRKDRWLWHIAPQGIEQKEYGVIHEVEAIEAVRAS